MKKPTDIDRYTKKRYYQLLQTTDKPHSNVWTKTRINRRLRRKASHKCHVALTNPKVDISDRLYRVDSYDLTDRGCAWTFLGTEPFGLGRNGEPIRNSPDPSRKEIKRLPEWLKSIIKDNIKTAKDRFRYTRWRLVNKSTLSVKLIDE